MDTVMKKHILVIALSLVSLVTLSAHAESNIVVGTGAAAARLDFRVVLPRVLFLGVGTGAAGSVNNATVDRLTFDYTTNGGAVGGGAPAATITNSGGFAANAIPVRVLGNNGQIVLTSTNSGNLVNSVTPADTIPFSQITSASSDPTLPVPAAAGGTANPTFNTGSTKVTTRTANWTFAYANTVTPAAGTYDGTVTYTASMP
jgi:hypothetical protein